MLANGLLLLGRYGFPAGEYLGYPGLEADPLLGLICNFHALQDNINGDFADFFVLRVFPWSNCEID
jgi:hypothetical protein